MPKRKSNAKARYHDEFLLNNPIPIHNHPDYMFNQKKFTVHDMKSIQPMTLNQERVFDLWQDDYNIVLSGSAGTGKTLVATYLALKDILDLSLDKKYEKIIIIRSSVPSREMGFLKGSVEEKMEVYETPYVQIFDFIFKKSNQYKYMKEAGLVEFQSTSFLRGQTFSNAIIILDEAAGLTYHEISTVLTRVGDDSKIVIIGDVKQNDLIYKKNDVSGFAKFLEVSTMMQEVRQVTFTREDIVRSGFVKSFIIADEMWDDRQQYRK